MFLNLRKKWYQALIAPKILWTIITAIIYIIGRSLAVPTVPLSANVLGNIIGGDILNSLAAVTGANFSEITLFTLGVGPWMTTMIIWRFFTVFGMVKSLTSNQIHYYRMVLTVIVASIQALSITLNIKFTVFSELGEYAQIVGILLTILILVAGSMALVWIGNMNGQRGLGGMTIIILINMILSFRNNVIGYLQQNDASTLPQTIGIFLAILTGLVVIAITLFYAERRIQIKRISLNTSYNEGSYIPIRLMPAGAMPFMYGMTLMMLPPYIISLLLNYFPENQILLFLATNIGVTHITGVIFYMLLLYVLAIGFAYYNYDAHDIAKNMRNGGDYIENIPPGNQTKKYLQSKISFWAHVGAILVVLIGGLPMLIIVLQTNGKGQITLAILINNAYIIATLLLGIIEQIRTLRNWKKYKNII